jgi:NAD(P)-dependent dehydrogenase (short-subunit alcohol dehydrogenase family)
MRTVVMTGATSGIGMVAAQHMLRATDVQLLVGARGKPLPAPMLFPWTWRGAAGKCPRLCSGRGQPERTAA